MAKKINPRELLEDVLLLIEKDVEEIKKMNGKLDGDVAGCLVKYSDALLKIVKDADAQKDEERAKLSSLTTEELKRKAAEFLEKGKK